MMEEHCPKENWTEIARDAALLGVLLCLVALLVNFARPHGLPLVAQGEYETLVPCPEPLGEVFPAEPTMLVQKGTLVIDAREPEFLKSWMYPGAMNIPFDYLEPVGDEAISRLIRARARRIVVYGDGENPDTGRELGRELSGRGIRNVFFLEGGAPGLKKAQGVLP